MFTDRNDTRAAVSEALGEGPHLASHCRLLAQLQPLIDAGIDPKLTVKEAAVFNRVSTATIWRWARRGAIPEPIRLGGKTFFSVSYFHQVAEKESRDAA